jgi:hypothetical protein
MGESRSRICRLGGGTGPATRIFLGSSVLAALLFRFRASQVAVNVPELSEIAECCAIW